MNTLKNIQSGTARGFISLETSLILPVFVFLMFVSVEFGRMLWVKSALNEAAEAGARLAMLYGPSDFDVEKAVRSRLLSLGLEKECLVSVGPRKPGRPVVVTVEADLDMLLLPSGPLNDREAPRLKGLSVMTHVR